MTGRSTAPCPVPRSYASPIEIIGLLPVFREHTAVGAQPNPFGSVVVQGENLAAMKSLLNGFQGQVNCVYLDPPYNNNESYTHYEDRWDRGEWAKSLRLRLGLVRELLREDGSVWISIDDAEMHHLRVIAEGVFGSENFVSTVIWNHRKTRENRKLFSANHEYILCFAKDKRQFKDKMNRLPATSDILLRYKNPDSDPRGPWQSISASVQDGHATSAQFYTIRSPVGALFDPPKGRCWVYNESKMKAEIDSANIYFGKRGTSVPRIKKFLHQATLGIAPSTLWTAEEVGTTDSAKKHLLRVLHNADVFDTPKPEELIHRILALATDPGDLVLDPYLGSGTTAAVAMKMGRAFVGIERGDHAVSHAAVRLCAAAQGEDGGVSAVTNWRGGGGFSFFTFHG